jgi:prepilin-type N-terminal cleavage/methylation domain-containing protein
MALSRRRRTDVTEKISKLRTVAEAKAKAMERRSKRYRCGFTLAEVLVSLGIAGMLFAGLITAYVQSSYRAEWSGYSLAAQSLAVQQLEQAKSANWNINTTPVQNELTNVPAITSSILDLPVNGTNFVWATNYTTITSIPITNTVGASVYMVRVDTAWPFTWAGKRQYYTNTVADYFAPD